MAKSPNRTPKKVPRKHSPAKKGPKKASGTKKGPKKSSPKKPRQVVPLVVDVRSWWAQKWIRALEKLGEAYANRLPRGRSYAKNESVVEFEIEPGHISARVLGSFEPFYDVEISLPPIPEDKWEGVLVEISSKVGYYAPLVNGIMPENIDHAFKSCDLSLFPKSIGEIQNTCTCADFKQRSQETAHFICKHIAAVHFVLAWLFETDPFILFEIRGKGRQEVLGKVRGSLKERESPRTGQAQDTSLKSLGDDLVDVSVREFFSAERLDEPTFHLEPPDEQNPLFSAQLLPASLKNPAYFKRVLSTAIKKASAWAYRVATEEHDRGS